LDNSYDKQIGAFLKTQSFDNPKEITPLNRDVVALYGTVFTNGDVTKAIHFLAGKDRRADRDVLASINMYGGMILVLCFMIFTLIVTPTDLEVPNWVQPLSACLITYYFLGAFIIIFFGVALCIHIFKAYGINYTYIFEIDAHSNEVNQFIFLKMALKLLFVWMLGLMMQIACFRFGLRVFSNPEIHVSHNNGKFVTGDAFITVLVLLTFIYCAVNPGDDGHSRGRAEMYYTFFNIFKTPFGLVKFRHFFLTDIITSMTGTLQNVTVIYCYYGGMRQTWRSGEEVGKGDECKADIKTLAIIIGFMPYWFRFGQCLNKYWNQRQDPHHKDKAYLQLLNAGKYSTSILTHVAGIWVTKHKMDNAFTVYLAIKLISTAYSCVWDFIMDWGLFINTKENTFLRDTITYPRAYYYYAMV